MGCGLQLLAMSSNSVARRVLPAGRRPNFRRNRGVYLGCGTHWQTLGQDFGKMGINARLLDGFDESRVEVRKFDNAG
jgi:hypothetical protein